MSKNIEDLRALIFETIAGVRDGTTTLDQAKVISTLLGNATDTMKVEVDYLRVVQGGESAFIDPRQPMGPQLTHEEPPAENGVVAITRHLMRR